MNLRQVSSIIPFPTILAKLVVWLVVGMTLAGNSLILADTIPTPMRYEIERSRPTQIITGCRRGESVDLQLYFFDYGMPVDLTHAYAAFFNYKAAGSTNVYTIEASFLNRTNGAIIVPWRSSNELPTSSYIWDVVVTSATTSMNRARGTWILTDNIGYNATTNTLQPIWQLDFATVQLLNPGFAPFISGYEISDIRTSLASMRDGSGNLDVNNLTVRGLLNYPDVEQAITNLTVAGFGSINRTGPHTAVLTITGDGVGGGGSGGGIGSYTNTSINGQANSNHVYIVNGTNTTWLRDTNGQWSVNVQVPAETEPSWTSFSNSVLTMAASGATAYGWGNHANAGYLTSIPGNWVTTGTNAWVINGQTVGYVTTNGIRLLSGTLTLDNYDLDCNVRLYDGSRTTPSLTPQGHPNTWGLFFRGYNSSYAAAWSQNGIEIGILSGLGINLSTTNAAFTGRHVGDMSGGTAYPEPIATNWLNSRMLPDITITNSGSITVKDAGYTTRFSVNGSSGATSIRGQDSDVRYALAPTNMTAFAITNVFPAGVTNIYKFTAQGICTNHP